MMTACKNRHDLMYSCEILIDCLIRRIVMEYDAIDQKERDIMHSLGFIWNGHGWQRAYDTDDGGMIVEGWIGGMPHIWDQKIAEINKQNEIVLDSDYISPFSQGAKDLYRQESDKAIGIADNAVKELDKEIKRTLKDIAEVSGKLANPNQTELEKAALELILSKLKLRKERMTSLRDEAKKAKAEQERKKLNNENWFFSREKPTSEVRKQQSLNREKMAQKMEEEKNIQSTIDKDKKRIAELEQDQKNKEQEYNRHKAADMATPEGLIRAENKANGDEAKAKKDIESANNRYKQAQNEKAKAESSFPGKEKAVRDSENKIKKMEHDLDEFMRWNSEVDYGKKEWNAEVDGWFEQISNEKKSFLPQYHH